jgi:hypothetical protein
LRIEEDGCQGQIEMGVSSTRLVKNFPLLKQIRGGRRVRRVSDAEAIPFQEFLSRRRLRGIATLLKAEAIQKNVPPEIGVVSPIPKGLRNVRIFWQRADWRLRERLLDSGQCFWIGWQ